MKTRLPFFLTLMHAIALTLVITMNGEENVATHFGLFGEADAYASKWTYLLLAFLPLLFSGAGMLLKKYLPSNVAVTASIYAVMGAAIFFIPVGWLLTLPALDGADSLAPYILPSVFMLLGALICYLSFGLVSCPPNRMTGIRTKATLESPEIWKKTHYLASKTGTAGGAVLMLCSLLAMLFMKAAFVLLGLGLLLALLGLLYPALYAQRLWKKK